MTQKFPETLADLVQLLQEKNILKFGQFRLHSGKISPVYLDLRRIVAYPDLLSYLTTYLLNCSQYTPENLPDQVCGVAYTGIPIATTMSLTMNVPMLMIRKERKKYGTNQLVEGEWQPGQKVLLIDDVITSGGSLVEAVNHLRDENLEVSEIVVFMDRRTKQTSLPLELQNIPIRSVCNLSQVLELVGRQDLLSQIETNSQSEPPSKRMRLVEPDLNKLTPKVLPLTGARRYTYQYREHLSHCHPVTKQLLKLMTQKQTNLCLSADVTKAEQLLKLADQCGPHICLLKLHWDILEDATGDTIQALKILSEKHQFLIMEDRKMADIGNTVKHQVQDGPTRLADWVDAVTVHSLPGPGVLQAFEGLERPVAVFIIAQMSSAGNLVTPDYTAQTVALGEQYPEIVAGFVSQEKVASDHYLYLTPGAKLQTGGDDLCQRYRTPRDLFQAGTDIMIVGRGIIQAEDPLATCQAYQQAGWQAYQETIKPMPPTLPEDSSNRMNPIFRQPDGQPAGQSEEFKRLMGPGGPFHNQW